MAEVVASSFVMIGAREVLLTGAAHLERQILALESAASSNPGLAFDLAKTLLESACKTVLSERACKYENGWDLPKLLKETLSQIQLVPHELDAEAEVSDSLRKTAGGLQTTIQGICELRNTHGFASHGKDPAFQDLESVQALLVARAVDAIVSFMFRAHQGYQRQKAQAKHAYADHPEFNEFVDDSNAPIQVFSEEFAPSRVLFEMAPEPYRVYLTEYLQGEQVADAPANAGEAS